MTVIQPRSIYRVSDIEEQELTSNHYHLGIFASGYEPRAPFVARKLDQKHFDAVIVAGFTDLKSGERMRNDEYFNTHWTEVGPELSTNDDLPLLGRVRERLKGVRHPRILVDYSSMSRVWYSAVLNWARFSDEIDEASIDFVYSVGSHLDDPFPRTVIGELAAIPGCEGRSAAALPSVVMFGLGFDRFAALAVIDKLEPDAVEAFIAAPAAFDDYPALALKANQEMLETNTVLGRAHTLTLFSVERCFSILAELVAPYRDTNDTILVPLGPKPHVLACILLAMKLPEVSCLRLQIERLGEENVSTTGVLVSTRVELKTPTEQLPDVYTPPWQAREREV